MLLRYLLTKLIIITYEINRNISIFDKKKYILNDRFSLIKNKRSLFSNYRK